MFINKSSFLNHFPIKHLADALAICRLTSLPIYSFEQKGDALRYYFNSNGINNLFVSLPRSGASWLELTFAIAKDLAEGGDGDYTYDGEQLSWAPNGGWRHSKFDWRYPAKTINRLYLPKFPSQICFFHSHHPYHMIRSAKLKKMRIVFVVRSILESIESNYFKLSRDVVAHHGFSDTSEGSFPWDQYINEAVDLYNSWGEVSRWHKNILVLRYERIKANELGAFNQISDHWNLDIPKECLAEALKRTSKKAMQKKLLPHEKGDSQKVSYRKIRGSLSNETFEYIINRLRSELRHDFGYVYDMNHEYKINYK